MAESSNRRSRSTVGSRAIARGTGPRFRVRSVQSRARAFRTLGRRF